MSKEIELIRDMKILLECTDMGGLQRQADVLIGRAIELLAQPEPEPEAVAWMWTRTYEGGGYTNMVFQMRCMAEEYAKDSENLKIPDIITPLYTSPPKREPLRDEEIFSIGYKAGFAIDSIERDLALDYGFLDEDGDVDNEPYFKLVRAIEKAHGIGESNES